MPSVRYLKLPLLPPYRFALLHIHEPSPAVFTRCHLLPTVCLFDYLKTRPNVEDNKIQTKQDSTSRLKADGRKKVLDGLKTRAALYFTTPLGPARRGRLVQLGWTAIFCCPLSLRMPYYTFRYTQPHAYRTCRPTSPPPHHHTSRDTCTGGPPLVPPWVYERAAGVQGGSW